MDTEHIRKIAVLECEDGYSGNIMTIHPSGKYLAATSNVHDKVFVFNIEKQKLIKTLNKDDKKFSAYLAYSADGKYLIGQSEVVKGQHTLRIWDVEDNYALFSDDKPLFPTGNRLYATPDNRVYSWHFLSLKGDTSPKIYFYTVPDMKQSGYLQDYEVPSNVSISPDGRYMVDSRREFEIIGVSPKDFPNNVHFYLRIWRYPEMVLEKELKNFALGNAKSFAWTADSRYFLYGAPVTDKRKREGAKNHVFRAYHQSMKIFDIKTYQEIGRLGPMDSSARMLGFLNDEQYIIALTDKSTLDIWDRKSGQRIERYIIPKTGWAFAGLQNPADKNRIAFSHKDEIWIFEVQDFR